MSTQRTQHTPGWTAERLPSGAPVVKYRGRQICHAIGLQDARLIATTMEAAPELLAALKKLLALADEYSDAMRAIGRGSMDLGHDAPGHSVSGMARAAIAKAEGSAS